MTARWYIRRALRSLHVLGRGQSPKGYQEAEALEFLQDIMDDLRGDGLLADAWQYSTFPLVSLQQEYTVGPTGDFVLAGRPLSLDDAGLLLTGSTTVLPLTMLTRQRRRELHNPTQTESVPRALHYESGAGPNGTIWVWPIPTLTPTLVFWANTPLAQFTTLDTDLAFKEGGRTYIRCKLAIEMAPDYNRTPHPGLYKAARHAKLRWQGANLRLEEQRLEESPYIERRGTLPIVRWPA